MGYRNLKQCVDDLQRSGQLVRVAAPVDPHLEIAEIQRRVYAAGGPALLFTEVRNCRFPVVCNLFGTRERARFLFRDGLQAVRNLIALKTDPKLLAKHPWRYRNIWRSLWCMWPRKRTRGPVTAQQTTIDQLPQIQSWPNDGGAFITLPEVYTEHPQRPGFRHSNLGMYRVQMSGGAYQPNRQVGLHYQIERSIGRHHAAALETGERLRVNVLVGGPPSAILAAIMPLPDGIPELAFAAALSRQPIRMIHQPGRLPVFSEADFCISGTIVPDAQLPEGPFGDHLGYYSLAHDFPVLEVDAVWHRPDAIWPYTCVGRPPQEDTMFGELIHELTGPAIPTVIPGVHAVHAVDAAGVHPLLLAVGSERYVPYAEQRQPRELLTCANAILGQGQLSLAKYLMIAAREDNPQLDINDIPAFFHHVLSRVNWQRDLHFQTQTTIDTLDYSGHGLNSGSKLVIAAAGPEVRSLPTELKSGCHLPDNFSDPRICLPGVAAVQGPACNGDAQSAASQISQLCEAIQPDTPLHEFPLILVVDDSQFTSANLNNMLWVTFTRSDPAADVHGVRAFIENKHWGCHGPLVIDARIKPHHAPPLVEDPAVQRRVDQLAAVNGPLHGII